MSDSAKEYKLCKCGNREMISDYHYKSEELYETCDVCGYYHTTVIANKPEGDTPAGWKPEYASKHGETGFVLKIFAKGNKGYNLACIEKKVIGEIKKALIADANVGRFTITFKDNLGNYQTQIFNKSRYRITELIDIVSKNPDDYTIYHEINAESEIDALKKVAIAQTDKEYPQTIEWIKSLGITLEDIRTALVGWGACFKEVKQINK